jgi:dTDP-4-dehydrorhamnose reductase
LVRSAAESAPGQQVRGLTHSDLELTDSVTVMARFKHERPRAVIHCAALSQSTACQANPALARRVNVEATALLAELAADIPLIFFSTDLVFDGRSGQYTESAQVNPLSVYAETKVEAERVVLQNPRHTVVRTSLNGGPSPSGIRGFDEQIRHAWEKSQTLRLFTDEFRSPIPASITARAVWELLAMNRPGVYHIAGAERMSRWQIGQLLASLWPDIKPKMEATSLKEYSGAPRSPDTSLNCDKVQRLLSFPLPRFSEWVTSRPG